MIASSQLPEEQLPAHYEVDEVAFGFVGSVVPDRPEFSNEAFSRAGNMFQENLLTGMSAAGLRPSLILTMRPVRVFPHSKQIWVKQETEKLFGGLGIVLVSFLNLPLLKHLSAGLSVFWALICWSYRTRNAKHRFVLLHNLTKMFGILTVIAGKLIGAKVVVVLADIDVPGQTTPSTLGTRMNYLMQAILIPRLDGHIAVSDAMMHRFASGKPYVRLDGGISKEVINATTDAIQTEPRTDTRFTLGFAGTLNDTNGVKEVLGALALLPRDRYRLRIAGSGPLAQVVREAAAIDDRIEYLGVLSFGEVLALYRSADLLVNMRLTKSLHTAFFFPSKLVEYFATGVPVVTTCTGHVEEEFSEIAYLLHDESASGLASAIAQVAALSPEIRREKGMQARQYMILTRGWDAIGRRVANYVLATVLRLEGRQGFSHQSSYDKTAA